MLKKIMLALVILLVIGIVVFFMGPKVPIDDRIKPRKVPSKPDQLEAYLKQQESRFKDLRPNTEKKIAWASDKKVQTPLCVLYLHGWSASRKETAPLGEMLAKRLGANYFATRLTGHGQPGEALAKATVNDWLHDTVEAFAIAKVLGKQVILLGTSTGATLATWLEARREHKELLAHVFVSPNFSPKDERSKILTLPWGLHIAHALIGKRRSWKPANAEQGKYWTTSYPTGALLPLMGLVKLIDGIDLKKFKTPVMVIYSPKDSVISVKKIKERFPQIGASTKKLLSLPPAKSLSNHVIAGDILAPDHTKNVYKEILGFLGQLPAVKAQLDAAKAPARRAVAPTRRDATPTKDDKPGTSDK